MNHALSHRLRPLRWALTLPLLFATLGCPPTTTGTPDGGEPQTLNATCNLDSECKTGFLCDRERRRCVCTSDASCPASLYCNAFTGQCDDDVPGCTSDAECAASQYCEIASRTCRSRKSFCEPCGDDRECGTSSDRCVLDTNLGRSFCGKVCATDVDCPEGGTCQTVGGSKTCWPKTTSCEHLTGCTPNTYQACNVDTDCSEGSDQVCDKVQGKCVARVPSCPFGTVCNRQTLQCEAACTTDDECAADEACQTAPCRCTNNECVVIQRCRDHNECAAGLVCVIPSGQVEGECQDGCTQDSDCPQGHLCGSTGSRSVCVKSCASNADCTLAENCSGGACVPGCQTVEVCDVCEFCKPVTAKVNSCEPAGTSYCQTCFPPFGGCNGPDASGRYCCDLVSGGAATTNVWGTDCSGGKGCPGGFNCTDITNLQGTTIAQMCFPSGDTCEQPTCK